MEGLQPVLDEVVEAATRLTNSENGRLWLYDFARDEDELLEVADDVDGVRASAPQRSDQTAHASDELGLETVGLEPGEPIAVDDHLRAYDSDWLYAIGDVNGRALLTHMGKYQARLVARHIRGEPVGVARSAHGPLAPRVVFTDPQVAAVGHTLESAAKAGLPVVAVDHPTSGSAGASFYGRGAAGTSRLVVERARDRRGGDVRRGRGSRARPRRHDRGCRAGACHPPGARRPCVSDAE